MQILFSITNMLVHKFMIIIIELIISILRITFQLMSCDKFLDNLTKSVLTPIWGIFKQIRSSYVPR